MTTWHNPRNHASTTVTSGDLNNTTSPITISVAVGANLGSTWPMWATVDPSGTPEVVEITARTGDSITMTRLSAVAHAGTPEIVCAVAAEYVAELQAAVDLKAPLASPTFTGTPAAPTASGGTNTTQIATTAFVASALAGVAAPSYAQVYNSGVISLSSGGETAITFDSEIVDTNSYHSTSSNTGRLTVPTTGMYLITWSLEIAANTSGSRYVALRKNGSGDLTAPSFMPVSGGDSTRHASCCMAYLTAGDYVSMWIYQSSGGSLDLAANAASPLFGIIRIG